MFVETLAHSDVLKHQELPGAPFQIHGALAQLLDRSRQLQGLLAVASALLREMLDDQPAAQGSPAQQQHDDDETCQHALAK